MATTFRVKILAMVLSLFLMSGAAFAASEEAVARWAGYDIIKGDAQGNFTLDKNMTKAEYITVLNRLLGLKAVETDEIVFGNVDARSWYAVELKRALTAGYLEGVEKNGQLYIDAKAPLTKEAAEELFQKAFQYDDTAAVFAEASFDKKALNRGDVFGLLDDAIANYYDAPGVYTDVAAGLTVVNSPGVELKDTVVDGVLVVTSKGVEKLNLRNSTVKGICHLFPSEKADVRLLEGARVGTLSALGNLSIYLDSTAEVGTLAISNPRAKVAVKGGGRIGKSDRFTGATQTSERPETSETPEVRQTAHTYKVQESFLGAPTYTCRVYKDGVLQRGYTLYVNGYKVSEDKDLDGKVTTVKNYFNGGSIGYSTDGGRTIVPLVQ